MKHHRGTAHSPLSRTVVSAPPNHKRKRVPRLIGVTVANRLAIVVTEWSVRLRNC